MGTIGHSTLLHSLRNWQVHAAIRGYYRQQRATWESTRQHAWYILSALGADNLEKPTDLIRFPWDHVKDTGPTKEEIEILQEEMKRINGQK